MKGQWHGGKGSAPRDTDHNKYADGWDRIWANKKDNEQSENEDAESTKSDTDDTR